MIQEVQQKLKGLHEDLQRMYAKNENRKGEIKPGVYEECEYQIYNMLASIEDALEFSELTLLKEIR